MTSRRTILVFVLMLSVVAGCSDTNSKSGLNGQKNSVPPNFEQKAKELVAAMTLEEKVSQMNYESPAIERLDIPEYNWWNECLHGVARAGKATVFSTGNWFGSDL